MVATKQIQGFVEGEVTFQEKSNRNYFYNNEIKSRKNVGYIQELSLNVNKVFFHNLIEIRSKTFAPCTYKCIKIVIFMTDHIVLSK
jgi:hypothetical protein